jgi:outer membrane biosynthesis protein TonB
MSRAFFIFFVVVAATVSYALPAFAFIAKDDIYDPPTRAARLSYVQGDVSLQPGNSDEWGWASINRPLTTGDNMWTAQRSRTEIRIGSTAVRADDQTSLSLLNLDDRAIQFGLNSGTVIIHVRDLPEDGYFEVDTPNTAVSILRPGDYRIEADASGDFTSVSVRKGQVEVAGDRNAFKVNAGSSLEASGVDNLNYALYDLPASDDFDRWSRTRDWRHSRSQSLAYVSPELTGYEDLDTYGTWVTDITYGPVWTPVRQSRDWTPYREGRWVWVEPWGWSWLDDAPWGYATSHYGRWTYISGHRWAWVPPQRTAPHRWPVYSPANVVFVRNTHHDRDRNRPLVAWFPLGPGETYVPAYRTSSGYITRLNETNTRVYTHQHRDRDNGQRYVSQNDYTNALIVGAIVAVTQEIFSSAKPVGRSTVHVSSADVMSKEVAHTAPVAPTEVSVLAPSEKKETTTAPAPKPPEEVRHRHVRAKEVPPPKRVSFSRKQSMLEQNEGKPLDPAAEKSLSAETAAPAETVKTVSPDVVAKPAEEMTKKTDSPHQRGHRQRGQEQQQQQPEAPAAAPTPETSSPPPEQSSPAPAPEPPPAEVAPQPRTEEQPQIERRQKQEERRKAREESRKAREMQQPFEPPAAEENPDSTPPAETAAPPPSLSEPPQQGETESGSITVDAVTAEKNLISEPKLRYPHDAEKAGVEGTVKVHTVIGTDGRVKKATAVEGPEELKDAARKHVSRRRYQPTVVDGKPVEVQTDVSVDFQKPQ